MVGVCCSSGAIRRPLPRSLRLQKEALAIFSPFVWALHANSSLALFWLLAHLACDAPARAAIDAEVDAAWAAAAGDAAALTGADLGASLPLLTSACWEALRLYSYAFGARAATADVDVPLVGSGTAGDAAPRVAHVRKGDSMLLVVQHHRDAAAFPPSPGRLRRRALHRRWGGQREVPSRRPQPRARRPRASVRRR